MRLNPGWFAAAALVATAGVFGAGSPPARSAAPDETPAAAASQTLPPAKTPAASDLDGGPCGELERTLQTFLWTSPDGVAAPSSCYGEGASKGKKTTPSDAAQPDKTAVLRDKAAVLREKAASLKFVIAILPDPVHTHFSLGFDRLAESIQQGVQDESYFYDSSWLPWEKAAKPDAGDQEKTGQQARAREDQPGILLFRKRPRTPEAGTSYANYPYDGQPNDGHSDADQPYRDGLAVFIVGEEPTTGIHKRQFDNALQWIAALQPLTPSGAAAPRRGVSILGPNFSGSLPSLAQLLAQDSAQIQVLTANAPHRQLMVFSGGITSLNLVRWFVRLPETRGKVRFRSFQTDGDTLLGHYRDYLVKQKFELARLAIVSEDETAYGGYSDSSRAASGPCAPVPPERAGPVCLYYPRDISALRDAYQKQSIFSSKSSESSTETPQRTLNADLADPEGKQHDTIRSYSVNQTALSQEAVLEQIVSMLKVHDSQYVVLRSSNPLDQLFLSHYLRLTYPQGRIVIEGADLLLRRESGAAALSGIMTLTTYPLLPWEHHWTGLAGTLGSHAHRVFSQDGAEGNYLAMRFLMHPDCIAAAPDPTGPDLQGKDQIAASRFLPPDCSNTLVPNYAPPFWARAAGSVVPSSTTPIGASSGRPATWLSVLGRDGFWPIAALTDTSLSDPEADHTSRLEHALWSLPSDLGDLWPRGDGKAGNPEFLPGDAVWPPMPLSMKLCLLAMLVFAGFHFHCCLRPSLTVKPGHRAHFVRLKGRSHLALLLFGSITLATLPVLLAWGYGAMSRGGEPLAHAWWARTILPSVWLLAGLALAANVLVEAKYEDPFSFRQWTKGPRWLRLMVRVLACYVLATYLLYGVVDFFLDETLLPANRFPTYWRAINLTTGVSPLVPLMALTAGLYLWFWYSLQGLSLLGPDRPQLPTSQQLEVQAPTNDWHTAAKLDWHTAPKLEGLRFLSMFSQDKTATPIEDLSHPFSPETIAVAAALFVVIGIVAYLLAGGVPVRSLGSLHYSILFSVWMDLCISLLLANAWQLLRVWLRLRQLLLFLDRLPLRRTMKAMKGYSWGSVWKMGGNILDLRYKLLSRQSESLTHLTNSLACAGVAKDAALCGQLRKTRALLTEFAKWYGRNWDEWSQRNLSALQAFQESVAETAGVSLAGSVLSEWHSEGRSVLIGSSPKESDAGKGDKDDKDDKGGKADKSSGEISDCLRNAEELICLVYLGFIQNVLGRLRTIAMSILWLFVAATVSVATYPFDPRPTLSGTMLALFLIIGVAVATVYSQMHRDATLSYVTDTNPGELGSEFWFKLLSFGVGPLLGLLATIFPELPGSLFSWLQPGLSAMK